MDKINLSFDAPRGSLIVYFIVWKNNTDMISAMEQHDVGCLKKRKEQKFLTESLPWNNKDNRPIQLYKTHKNKLRLESSNFLGKENLKIYSTK